MDLTGHPRILIPAISPISSDELFDKTDDLERRDLERHFVVKRFQFDELIFEQGTRPASVWRLVSGTATLTQRTAGPDPAFLARIVRPGDIFALSETLARRRYGTTLRAVSTCVFERMDHAQLVSLLRNRPHIRNRMLETLARRHLEAMNALATDEPCDPYHIPANERGIELVCNSPFPVTVSNN